MKLYSFQEHLSELKVRLSRIFIIFIVAFAICYYFSDNIYSFLLEPLAKLSKDNLRNIIYTGLTEAFFTYIKLAAFAAFAIIIPVIALECYLFVSPGLYRHEKKIIAFILFISPKNEHEYMTNASETILQKLGLPYRTMLLCTGDMGFASQKTYDIEVWLPGQKQYREIASCSNCGDFQARRMKARYKEFGSHDTTLVHTLNASGLPIGRTMVAILENYQNEDGSITVPDVLVNYMGGLQKITAY